MSQLVFEVIDPGLETVVQSFPGRTGLMAYGYRPAGPMDPLSLRAANALVGNSPGCAVLEIPKIEMSLAALADTQIAVCAPPGVVVHVDDRSVHPWETVNVGTGSLVRIAGTPRVGYRSYLAIRGGIDVPEVYGSTTTSLIAGTGGLEGRALVTGDVIFAPSRPPVAQRRLPYALRPRFSDGWELEVIAGPHCHPDYLTPADWALLLDTEWRVDVNSDRVATRLHPYTFTWDADRIRNGVAGGHPSNVLDQAYPDGAVIATGDVLTISGPEGNTSGGFAVIATVPRCARWKIGQLRPGRDSFRFRQVTYEEALALDEQLEFNTDPRRTTPARRPTKA